MTTIERNLVFATKSNLPGGKNLVLFDFILQRSLDGIRKSKICGKDSIPLNRNDLFNKLENLIYCIDIVSFFLIKKIHLIFLLFLSILNLSYFFGFSLILIFAIFVDNANQ